MRKTLLVLLVTVFVVGIKARAQQDTVLLKQINKAIEAEISYKPATSLGLHADSVLINNGFLNIYFNTKQSFIKGALSANAIELMPEALLRFTRKAGAAQLMLYAREAITNEWKTIDYFSDEPAKPIYVMPPNNDPYEPIVGKGTTATSRVFPGGGSPTPTGALSGKTVWLSPGHGWYNENNGGYTTQRGTTNELVEDFITAEGVDYYLNYYLANAGANVWSVRERDVNANEIIVNNDVPASGYVETGTWTTGSSAGYGGTYRVATANATETATAIYTPNVVQSGYYWVSVRFVAGANRVTDALYTIYHSGDSTKFRVNQEVHSNSWIYLGQFYFTAGGNNKIILSNQSAEAGQAVIADAVRLGGGIGQEPDCTYTSAGVSGQPRFEESARQYARFQGYPTCYVDVNIRPYYSEWELSKGVPTDMNNAVYVSWHTNAGGGTGTETYSYNGLGSGQPNITAGSVALRNYIHNQVVSDIRAGWRSTWTDRGAQTANFGELRNLGTIPGILLELAFHDLASDAADLKQPEFRRLAARAIYKGILKFFNNRDGVPLIYLPEQPTNVLAKNTGGSAIQIQWQAPVTGGIYGNAATGYKVYVSTNGRSFADGVAVSGTSYTFNGNPQTTYYFKVTATNAGGESFSSSVVAARTPISGSTSVPYLIVDGFDRLDASAMIPKYQNATLGTVKRMFLERMNRYDYMIEHAQALANCSSIAFDGCENEAVSAGNILLSNYLAVDWFTGEESTVDKSLDATERSLLKTYLNAGGNLLLSGSEIGWDIGRAASANVDLDFYNNYLKATFVDDNAGTYNFAGTPTLYNTQTGTFDNSTNGYYDVDSPDRIAANGGSAIALTYVGGTADGAGVGYKGAYNLLYFSFPFEAITSATVRNNLMCNAVAYLTPGVVVPVSGLSLSGKNNGSTNTLTWKTVSETNTKYMLVERSDNGIMFNAISQQIAAKGSLNAGADYSFVDYTVLASGYYRIKVIDADGKVSFSNTVFIKIQKQDKLFTLINNPTQGNIRLAINTNENATVQLSNSIGQLVYSNKNIGNGNGAIYAIPVGYLAKGIYTLTMVTGNQKQVEKVIVQ